MNEIKFKKVNYFMKVADLTAKNSTCIKKEVGAILVRDGKLLSTGYNGAPTGIPHCTLQICLRKNYDDNEHPEMCRGVHAEVNCIIQCAIHGTQIGHNAILYCTYFPCMSCIKMIINAGIKYIIFENDYEMGNLEKMKIISDSSLKIYKLNWINKTNNKCLIVQYLP